MQEFLRVQAKGHITTFVEHLERHRKKVFAANIGALSAEAVVGALDSRQKAAKSKSGKALDQVAHRRSSSAVVRLR